MENNTGVGLDCGTMNFVSARANGKNIDTSRIRNAFIDLEKTHKRMLRLSDTNFIELDDSLLVVGDKAIDTANLLNREARRPMAGGILNSGEIDAKRVIALMIKEIVGNTRCEREKCCYSVPAPAIDVAGSDITYHSAILGKILEELGFDPEPVNEAMAIIYSECIKENFSGVGISFGSGMTNVCLAYNGMEALTFSIGKGGDWIDNGAAQAVGSTKSKITSLKESGINIMKPEGDEAEAIAVYLRRLISDAIDGITKKFMLAQKQISVPSPVPIVVSGGTSKAHGFLELFQEVYDSKKKKFPFEISEIRSSKDPITAVSTGLLMFAQLDD